MFYEYKKLNIKLMKGFKEGKNRFHAIALLDNFIKK